MTYDVCVFTCVYFCGGSRRGGYLKNRVRRGVFPVGRYTKYIYIYIFVAKSRQKKIEYEGVFEFFPYACTRGP